MNGVCRIGRDAGANGIVAGLIAVLLLIASGLAAAAEPMRLQRVAEGAWFVQGEAALGSSANRNFISNAGVIVTGDGVVVIDALGSPPLAEELIAAIRELTPQPIRHVIVTHYHADHVYGLQAFKAVGATVIAHQAGRAYLTSETARLRMAASRIDLFPWIDEPTHLVPADRWIDAIRAVSITISATAICAGWKTRPRCAA